MYSKTLLFFLVVFFLSDYSYGQRDKKYFRKDYTYLEGSESFYKIHTIHKTWADAKKTCAQEGASFFYPENDNEAHVVLTHWNKTQPFWWVFIGVSDLVAKGIFETIDGTPITDVYHNWGRGEPNDSGGNEDCVILRHGGTLNDDNCFYKYPFICKKSLQSLEWNQNCNSPNLDYVFNEEIGRCYKFHSTPSNWTDAYAVCSVEQSYLAVINTQLEADYLANLTETSPKGKVKGKDFTPGIVHLGFHDRANEGWQTVRGTTLEDSGYEVWSDGQPDGDDREKTCGSMLYNGQLNAVNCETRSFFICELEVDTLSSHIDGWYGDDTIAF